MLTPLKQPCLLVAGKGANGDTKMPPEDVCGGKVEKKEVQIDID